MPLYPAITLLDVLERLDAGRHLDLLITLSASGMAASAQAWLDVALEVGAIRDICAAAGIGADTRTGGYPITALRAAIGPNSSLRGMADRAEADPGYWEWLEDNLA